ncbi:mRNA interferase RelE/StbE [Nicoletella semolina]|uniref:mRNA interferase RelE/StbE n=1 Tax=Nicoletella semolina TaxID=271160 RepID=A0A4R2NAF2_9PAST|nr:type II toxin-antitoxin system RelE/ParE family toxin [Nicoletella semolina]MDH2923956.1 addiction module toxin RelE [Nicoletella semolina]TCP18079.1 mRNA interferase RelE/StbE [Nicoletella semolina]
MTYKLVFETQALKEWQKLNHSIREQFKKKLAKVLENPEIPANKLREIPNGYKIKLRSAGYRLIYQVQNQQVTVVVVAIGKRERSEAYETAKHRLAH